MAEEQGKEVVLPGYMQRQADGIFVDLSLFPVGGGFAEHVERLFAGGQRFRNLDYHLFSKLLYDFDAVLDAHGISGKVRLADAVVDFPVRRKALYKSVKIDGACSHAEYFFEPALIEVVTEEPVYGEPGDDGVAPIVGSARKSEMRPTKLDFDEFIADLWLKGVRFGIARDKVAQVIADGETVRMDVALQLDATEGRDAEVEEATSALHRDNSPKILPNGQADLRKFQNRFPQISKGARLLMKRKRELGKPGRRVDGALIEPPLPEDFDLNALAGEGTRVESQGANEYIIATRDGFLSLDLDTNHIAVTEKIENKSGVSAKTTGDLSLTGNEFIEHGEVQEGRVVEGKNMTFRSDVYGQINSHGGSILLESNLSGGGARSLGGDVTSNGRALNSVVEAWEGRITMKYAEGCLVLGESVVIERAVNCEIAAKDVQVGSAEGCGIAGRNVRIDTSDTCRGKETVVSMLVPSLTGMDTQIRQLRKAIVDSRKAIEVHEQALSQLKSDEETTKYLALEASIRQGAVKLNASQQENWQKMSARFAKANAAITKLNADKQEQMQRIASFEQEIAYLLEARRKSGEGIHCTVGAVNGDTLVRTMVAAHGVKAFRSASAGELRISLREQGLPQERVFFNDAGALEWDYSVPELEPD